MQTRLRRIGLIFVIVSNCHAFVHHQTGRPIDAPTTTKLLSKSEVPIKRAPARKKKANNRPVPRINTKTVVPRLPPPLLVGYENALSEQERRLQDDSIKSECEHFAECAGCTVGKNVADIDNVRAAQQFFAKERYEGNRKKKDSASSFPVVIPSKTTGWRTQAKLVASNKSSSSWMNDGCVFGLYKKSTHQVLTIPNCVVHHESINKAIQILERATAKARTVAYTEDSRDGDLRYVQLQVERVSGKVCLTLVWNAATLKECQPSLSRLVKHLKNESFHSIWCHCNDGTGNNIFSRSLGRWHRLSGPEFLREPLPVESGNTGLASGWLYFSPLTFRQGNLDGFDVLALDVARAVPPNSRVCELYGGVGVLGLTVLAYHHQQGHPIAWLRCSDENPANPRCFERSVESLPPEITGRTGQRWQNRSPMRRSEPSKDGGMTMAELANLMESGKSIPESSNERTTEKTSYVIASAGKSLKLGQALGANVMIVDPPRKGLEDEVLDELCKPYDPNQPYAESATLLAIPDEKVNWTNDVQTLIYVSCGFDALARDCDRLLSSVGAGWTLQSSTGYILFPGSDHVETLAIFQRR